MQKKYHKLTTNSLTILTLALSVNGSTHEVIAQGGDAFQLEQVIITAKKRAAILSYEGQSQELVQLDYRVSKALRSECGDTSI